jgi:CheY-like chemotaxis protein
MLRTAGFNVYTTDLGEEGIDLGKLYDYDIILLDLNLPDMSGFEEMAATPASTSSTIFRFHCHRFDIPVHGHRMQFDQLKLREYVPAYRCGALTG